MTIQYTMEFSQGGNHHELDVYAEESGRLHITNGEAVFLFTERTPGPKSKTYRRVMQADILDHPEDVERIKALIGPVIWNLYVAHRMMFPGGSYKSLVTGYTRLNLVEYSIHVAAWEKLHDDMVSSGLTY